MKKFFIGILIVLIISVIAILNIKMIKMSLLENQKIGKLNL